MMRLIPFVVLFVFAAGCETRPPNSDLVQREQQEKILAEGTAQTGMPAIHNFRERKIVKDLFELRDQEGLVTWTYLWSPFTGRFTLLGQSVGYGIPAATQYTNPEKIAERGQGVGFAVLPQADPNGLFSPSAADATWILLLNPKTGKVEPQYIEERLSVFTYELPPSMTMVSLADRPPG